MLQITKYPKKVEWKALIRRPQPDDDSMEKLVRKIFLDVQQKGDQALIKYTTRFDRIILPSIRVSEDEIKTASTKLAPELKTAIDVAATAIRKFHQAQMPASIKVETLPGVVCWQKPVPIEKVGLYIPGGTAPLFSTVLMLAIPAGLAGCKEIILCTPPTNNGSVHPAILYCAALTNVSAVYRVGGIQSVAAMTFGTESVPQVFKIFGPGNPYVNAAKQMALKYGVAIDLPAGPSEVLVMADNSCSPSFVAADLLSQAEHGADSQVMLLTTYESLIEPVLREVETQLQSLPRRTIVERCLKNSQIILLENLSDMIDFTNEYAPEHLILAVTNPEQVADKIINAGSVFLGNYSPESVGDYASGTNHTLPTNGSAKAWSGVNLDSFMKKITFQSLSRDGLRTIAPTVQLMAETESLEAHKNAITIRLRESL